MKSGKRLNVVPQVVRAQYSQRELPEHQGNPLVEALPSIRSATDLIPSFGHFPGKTKDLSQWGRLQMIDLLDQNYFEPMTDHLHLIQQLFLSIPGGYTFRNLASPEYRKALVGFYHNAKKGEIKPLYPWQPASHPGFALFGCSGVGKSMAIERILSYFPKAIYHPRYKTTQVVWVKVDCPADGSIKQFLLSVIQQFDMILGSTYLDDFGRLATHGLILAVGFLAAYHHLGLLVIDEIQNLLDARQHNDAVLLNHLVTLNNTIHIPIGYVGTIRAMELCQSALREARRTGTPLVWDRLQKETSNWNYFLESLWEYQWCDPVELSAELSDTMYYHTQGIHALVVRLFQLAQKDALINSQKITPKSIRRVAHEKFILLEPMLHSLRAWSKDAKKFWSQKEAKKYEDLIYKTVTDPRDVTPPSATPEALPSCESEIKKTFAALQKMEYAKSEYEPIVLKMFDENPLLDANKAVSQYLSQMEKPEEETVSSNHLSLEQISQQSKAAGKTPLEGFEAIGLSPKRNKMT